MEKINKLCLCNLFSVLLGSFLMVGVMAHPVFAQAPPPIKSTDFISLFNQHRTGQPNPVPWAGSYFAYRYDGTAMGVNSAGVRTGSATSSTPSAMMEYKAVFDVSGGHEWEEQNHTCSMYSGADRESCDAWWGHCNGWSGAAIREYEPRKPATINGSKISVAGQKGLLTEYYLEADYNFEGTTDKSQTTGAWVKEIGTPSYRSFWDVTPRQFFLLLTNYIGVQQRGIIIDRFTGDQVWNQPMVGYRILPITSKEQKVKLENGTEISRYEMAMKIYWAEDGVHPGVLSDVFSIDKMGDSTSTATGSEHYSGRYLKFYLDFDKPLTITDSGRKVAGNARMVGNGVWYNQQLLLDGKVAEVDWGSLDQTHPDFVWVVLNAAAESDNYRNPFLQMSHLRKLSDALGGDPGAGNGGHDEPPPPPPPDDNGHVDPPQPPPPHNGGAVTEFKLSVVFRKTDELANLSSAQLKSKIESFFGRVGLSGSVSGVESSGQLIFQADITVRASSIDTVKGAFTDAGFVVIAINPR